MNSKDFFLSKPRGKSHIIHHKQDEISASSCPSEGDDLFNERHLSEAGKAAVPTSLISSSHYPDETIKKSKSS